MKATPVGSLHCLYTLQKAISSPLRGPLFPRGSPKKQANKLPGRHTGLPLRQKNEYTQKRKKPMIESSGDRYLSLPSSCGMRKAV